tara:strand:- start:4104 stop:5102 length:999 start_codon:yes stop_codon:yes gene_type:complete
MGVNSNTVETYDNNLIREDLQEAYTMISPEETPFQNAIRSETASNTLFEWPVVELAATDSANRVIEGEASPANNAATLGLRFSNYTQISDKVAEVSHTSQAVDAAAQNIQRLSEQVVLKMKEMKRDKEVMLLSNVAAVAGSTGVARTTAGLPAWLSTNTIFEAGGADPTLSGTTEGFPNAAATAGTTSVLFAEADLNDLIAQIWEEGGDPTLIMVNSGNKRRISAAFTGNATRYKDTVDKKVINSIDFYSSDFGELTVVPNRFQPTNEGVDSYNVFVLDPEYAAIAYLDEVQQKPLAETGHSLRTLIWCEYGLQIDNEKAHGVIRDTLNTIA